MKQKIGEKYTHTDKEKSGPNKKSQMLYGKRITRPGQKLYIIPMVKADEEKKKHEKYARKPNGKLKLICLTNKTSSRMGRILQV